MPASTVIIPNNNERMWETNRVIIEIMQAVYQNNDVLISLNGEGPCAESLGLFDLLDEVCAKTGYSKDRITIETHNLKEQHSAYKIKTHAPIHWILGLQKEAKDNNYQFKNITNKTKYFGNFVGHGSRIRVNLASYLYTNYRQKTFQTFHTSPKIAEHRNWLGIEEFWFHGASRKDIDACVELLDNSPLSFDKVETYPIRDEKMYRIIDCYDQFFVDIAYSTFFSGNSFYMDEKLWRPIVAKTPFIVHGPRNFIQNLKKLGFETFDQWWEELYSLDDPDYQCIVIRSLIDQIANYSIGDLIDMYNEMKPVLEHNYHTFLNLTENSFDGIEWI